MRIVSWGAWGLRRGAFALGAVLLAGGWGLTGYVDARQQAAGVDAANQWRDGVRDDVTPTFRTPSAWLYLCGVLGMMSGAGLMAFTVPWRGERKTGTELVAGPAPSAGRSNRPEPAAALSSIPAAAPDTAPAQSAAIAGSVSRDEPLQPRKKHQQWPLQSKPMQQPLQQPHESDGPRPIQYKRGA